MVRSNVIRSLYAGLAALIVCTGCRQGNADEPAQPSETVGQRPELVIFVYDRSTSIPDYQLNLAKELTDARIDVLEHGDKIAALQVLQLSLAEPPERFWLYSLDWTGSNISMPSSKTPWRERLSCRESLMQPFVSTYFAIGTAGPIENSVKAKRIG